MRLVGARRSLDHAWEKCHSLEQLYLSGIRQEFHIRLGEIGHARTRLPRQV